MSMITGAADGGADPLRPLARRLASGRDAAFPDLVESLASSVFSSALRLTGSRPDAEDITQETFIRVYHALGRYPDEQVRGLRLRAWVSTIALNLCRNHARGRSRRPITTELADDRHPADPTSTEESALEAVGDEWQTASGGTAGSRAHRRGAPPCRWPRLPRDRRRGRPAGGDREVATSTGASRRCAGSSTTRKEPISHERASTSSHGSPIRCPPWPSPSRSG